MSGLSIPIDDEPTNVIVLSEARKLFSSGKCQHKSIEVDEIEAEVTCKDCGARLNPVAVLVRLAKEGSRLAWRIDELKKLNNRFDEKKRTTCQHCGKMTNIRVGR